MPAPGSPSYARLCGSWVGTLGISICAMGMLGLLASCGGKSTVSMPTSVEVPFMGSRDRSTRPAPELRQSLYLPGGDKNSSVLELEVITPGELHPANPFEFRIRAANLTTGTILRNVTVLQELPPYVTLSSTTPTARVLEREASLPGNVVYSYELGEIPPGESREVAGRAVSPDSGAAGFRLSAEYNLAMDWQAPVVDPKVTVTKSAPTEVLSCEPIEYTVTVKNAGSGIARRLTIKEELPSGLTTNGAEAIEESIGDLAPGEERVVSYTVHSERAGVFESFVMLHGVGVEVESNRVTTTVVQPSLVLSRSPIGALATGEEATYRITVSNEGNAPASDLFVEETIPTGTAFVAASGNGVLDGNLVSWRGLELAVGSSIEFTVTIMRQEVDAMITGEMRASAHCAEDARIGAGR